MFWNQILLYIFSTTFFVILVFVPYIEMYVDVANILTSVNKNVTLVNLKLYITGIYV